MPQEINAWVATVPAQLEKFQALYEAAVAKLKDAISSAQADAILKAQTELKDETPGQERMHWVWVKTK